MTKGRVLLGVVAAPHGVRGLVRIRSFTEDPMAIASYGALSDETVEGDGTGWGAVIWAIAGEPIEPAVKARKVRPKSTLRMVRRCNRRGEKACPESRNSGRTAYHARIREVNR